MIFFLMDEFVTQVGGWTCQPLESPNPEESTKKPVIIAVVIIAAGGAEGQLSWRKSTDLRRGKEKGRSAKQVSKQRHGASVNHRHCGRSRRTKKRKKKKWEKRKQEEHPLVGETIGEGEKSQFASEDINDVDNVRPRKCVPIIRSLGESDCQFPFIHWQHAVDANLDREADYSDFLTNYFQIDFTWLVFFFLYFIPFERILKSSTSIYIWNISHFTNNLRRLSGLFSDWRGTIPWDSCSGYLVLWSSWTDSPNHSFGWNLHSHCFVFRG